MPKTSRRSFLSDMGRVSTGLVFGSHFIGDLQHLARGSEPKALGTTTAADGETTFITSTGAVWRWKNQGLNFPKGHMSFGGDTHAPVTVADKIYVGHTGPEGVSVFDAKTRNWIATEDFSFAKLKLARTHGLTASTDGDETQLWITTNSGGANQGRLLKTTLKGELLWKIGKPDGHEGAWNPTEFTAPAKAKGSSRTVTVRVTCMRSTRAGRSGRRCSSPVKTSAS